MNHKVFKLHLELNMECISEENLHILRKYGLADKGISRAIIIPADITLHALNYAILRMFGWQNSHLHKFRLPDDIFEKITENQFSRIWGTLPVESNGGTGFLYKT